MQRLIEAIRGNSAALAGVVSTAEGGKRCEQAAHPLALCRR